MGKRFSPKSHQSPWKQRFGPQPVTCSRTLSSELGLVVLKLSPLQQPFAWEWSWWGRCSPLRPPGEGLPDCRSQPSPLPDWGLHSDPDTQIQGCNQSLPNMGGTLFPVPVSPGVGTGDPKREYLSDSTGKALSAHISRASDQ